MDFPGECVFVVFDFFAHLNAPPGLKTPKIFFHHRNKVIMLVIGNIPSTTIVVSIDSDFRAPQNTSTLDIQ